MATTVMPLQNEFFQHLDAQKNQALQGAGWLDTLHQDAYAKFLQLGLPTRKHEAWKYIDLKPILSTPFQSIGQGKTSLDPADLSAYQLSDHPNRLVFVNGQLVPSLSQTPSLGNAKLLSVQEALSQCPDVFQSLWRQTLEQTEDAFVALNTALFSEGWVLWLPKNTSLADNQGIHILWISTQGETSPEAAYTRGVIALEEGAKAQVTLDFIGLSNHLYLNAPVLDVKADANSKLDLCLIQSEGVNGFNLAATHLHQATGSEINVHCLAFGSHTSRHHLEVTLSGEHATCRMNGLSLLSGNSSVYRHVVVNHPVGHCVSEQLFKGIINDQARSEFDGTIVVGKGANGTDATQLNKNLLLSGQARVYTRPQLQIDTDDVKCAHGATVGQLEEEELFYLVSRGLDKRTAQNLLTFGFAEEVIDRIDSTPLKERLTNRLLSTLKQGT
jgi:Fe-S cluster assembly protein SufD